MAINRKPISTIADGADAYTLSDAHGTLVNFANLSASGLLADAIRVTAAGASVQNFGTLSSSGDGSDTIGAGTFSNPLDGVSVTNFGVIHSSGNAAGTDDAPEYPSGIDLFGDNDRIVNFGTITSHGPDGAGASLVGSNGFIRNFGTIDAESVGIILDTFGGGEHANRVENFGLIRTHDIGLGHGIWVRSDANSIVNRGIISAEGVHDFGIALEGIGNQAANYGLINAAGEQARGVLMDHEGNVFTNYGWIEASGADSIGVRFGFEDGLSQTGSTFVNRGTVDTPGGGFAVLGSIPDEQVINRGTLNGDVSMGGGADRYVAGGGGHLNGILTLGDGDDTLVFERHGGKVVVSDFAAGPGSDDRIDLSAFHLHGFADVMSHASQSGADVLIGLGGGDQIVLQATALASLNAADFILG